MSVSHAPRLVPLAISLTAVAIAASALVSTGPARSHATRPAALTAFAVRAEPAAPAAVTGVHRGAKFKKGVGAWAFRGSRLALARSGASWYYTWTVNHRGITTPRGVSFVPMIWGPGSATAAQLKVARRHGHVLLAFNEPD